MHVILTAKVFKMKISKAKLRQIIKEEITRSFDDSRPVVGLPSKDAWGRAFAKALERVRSEGSLSQELYDDLNSKRVTAMKDIRTGDKLMDLIKDLRQNAPFDFDILKVDTEEWMEPTLRK
jgi:hypothetical protein